MSDEYGSDYISIVDEDGVEYELEVLAEIDYHDGHYLALLPADAEEEGENLEVTILKSIEENGETILSAVEDEAELEEVYNYFLDQIYEEEDDENS